MRCELFTGKLHTSGADYGKVTDVVSRRRCVHEQCRCEVPSTQEYCCNYCSDADAVTEVELDCKCGHPSCARSVSAFLISGTARIILKDAPSNTRKPVSGLPTSKSQFDRDCCRFFSCSAARRAFIFLRTAVCWSGVKTAKICCSIRQFPSSIAPCLRPLPNR
jgi:hypothetical protein